MSSVTRYAVRDVGTGRFFAEPDNILYTYDLWNVRYYDKRPAICEGQEVVLVDITHVVTPYKITEN